MKKIFLFTLFTINISHAFETYQLQCSGNRGKVNVVIEKTENKIRFTYNNLEGKKDFPLYDGIVTANTLPFIKAAQKDLALIDNKLVLEWNLDQCNLPNENPMIIACNGEVDVIFPKNSKLKSYDFYTSILSEKTPNFTYEMLKVRLGLDTDQMHYLTTMPFDPGHCQLSIAENILSK